MGLFFDPPDGPDMPVVEIQILLLLNLNNFKTIDKATSLLTAPCLIIFDIGTFQEGSFGLIRISDYAHIKNS